MAEKEVEISLPEMGLNRRQLQSLEEKFSSMVIDLLDPEALGAKSKSKSKIKEKVKTKIKTREISRDS